MLTTPKLPEGRLHSTISAGTERAMISVPLTEITCCARPPNSTATGSSKPWPKMVTFRPPK